MHPVVRLQFWRTGYSFIAIGLVILVRVLFMGPICLKGETEENQYKISLSHVCTYSIFLENNRANSAQRADARIRQGHVVILIIIILACHQHGYPWPTLATPPYRSSLLASPQGYILYPHRAAVCRFEMVALLLLGHVRRSIGEHHLWSRPSFSSSVWFV